MIAARRAMAVALMVVVVACGSTPAPTASPAAVPVETTSPTPTPIPTPPPSPTATPLPSPVTSSIPADGGTLAVPGGAALVVPKGVLKAAASATIMAATTAAVPTDAWPADAVGLSWKVDLGGAKLAKPVTLTLPYDPSLLPAETAPSDLLLAYADPASGTWVPVPATVDPATHTVRASVSHLSTWALFTINWDYWMGFIAKVASGNLTDLLGAVATLTTKCLEKSGGFVVDNSGANGMIKGCVQKVVNGKATIGVTNLKLVSFGLSGGALDAGSGSILDGGDTVTFTAGGTKLDQPLVAQASLSPMVLGYQLTDLVLRLLPGSDVFTKAGSYARVLKAIVTAEGKIWASAKIYDKLTKKPRDVAGAAEEAFKLLTDASFLGVVVKAAIAVGQKEGIPYFSTLTTARLNQVMLAANLAVLDATVLAWDVQYFLAAFGQVKVTWAMPPAAPTNLSMTFKEFDTCPPQTLKTWDGGVLDPSWGCDRYVVSWKAPAGVSSYHLYGCVNGFEYVTLCRAGGKPFATLSGSTTHLLLVTAALENPSFAISAIGPGGLSPIVQFP